VTGGIFVLILIVFLLIWLLLIRPQRRRQNDQLTMQDSLHVGDEIVTAGGMYGTVTAIDEDEVSIEVADGVVVRIARRAVAGVMPPEEDEEDEDDVADDEDVEDAREEQVKAPDLERAPDTEEATRS
jgi:preprotein translocase subunit YajC